ncbi:FRG domain-containing protein [Paenibacillus sp. p3-SID1389]|uniref:FRG domain-containing protein n=1 Tax=Paenibacillus sp. p3-SID1389 TaxID=2916364 RepID=UPI0021A4DF58|nr:FRG domain-containing protein [Paenibacillus sp. p3-SID1389]MCT2195391.1 FRG domain-containing protein [Paenibacillus sp. p3-SID1389]
MTYSKQWIEVINQVKNFSSRRPVVWFRGHGKHESFKLISGLFRDKFDSIEDYLDSEIQKYQEFLYLGYSDHKVSDWNLLFLMQHHGVKTRLLDWTESFVTALFFAYINWNPNEEDACVWMLDPTRLNYLTFKRPMGLYLPFGINYEEYLNGVAEFEEYSIALLPVRNNKRLIAQQGVFTLQGNSLLPLDEEHNKLLIENEDLIKILLNKELYEDVQSFLRQSGVNHYTLFPDLDGLAKLVNSPFTISSNGLRIPTGFN